MLLLCPPARNVPLPWRFVYLDSCLAASKDCPALESGAVNHTSLNWSAKGKSEFYLPSQFLSWSWSTYSFPSYSGPFVPLQMLDHGLLQYYKGKVNPPPQHQLLLEKLLWSENPREALILLALEQWLRPHFSRIANVSSCMPCWSHEPEQLSESKLKLI